jgi:hypothetical protein
MANVEVQLDVKAEYKQALAAIAMLSKALDAVQQRAKVAISVSNSSSGLLDGKDGATGMNPAEVEKLRTAMMETAKAAASVTTELVKLGSALNDGKIPPERLQEIADLAQNYNSLAGAVNAASAALDGMTGRTEGTPAQIGVLNEQVKLLQEQVEQLKLQLVEVQRTSPVDGGGRERGYDGPSNDVPGNVRTMTWLQQARAAKRLTQAIGELGESFSTMAKDAENGNLNLTEMVGNIAMLGYQMKGSLSRIGAVIVAMETLQNVWNTYARSAKRAIEAEKNIQETVKISEEAYKNVKKAKDDYLKQEARKDEILELKGKYELLNNEIERGLGLVKETIAAEIARLALQEDEAEHADTLKKAELGRKLMSGEISQEEYQAALIELNQQSKVRKAQGKVTSAEAKKRGTSDSLAAAQADYAEKERMKNERDLYLSQFLSEEELAELEKGRDTLAQRRDSTRQQFRDAEKRLKGKMGKHWTMNALEGALSLGKAPLELAELYEEVEALRAEVQAADRAVLDYESFIEESIGSDDMEGYKKRRKHAQEQLTIAESERTRASQTAEAAYIEDLQAGRELEETRTRTLQEIRQAGEYADSELETMRVKSEEAKKKAKREAEAKAQQAAEKEAARRRALGEAAIFEGRAEGNISARARRLASGKGYDMLSDNELSSSELGKILAELTNSANAGNAALKKLLEDIIKIAVANKMITAQTLKKHQKQITAARLNLSFD